MAGAALHEPSAAGARLAGLGTGDLQRIRLPVAILDEGAGGLQRAKVEIQRIGRGERLGSESRERQQQRCGDLP
jgi:hypothetical protein